MSKCAAEPGTSTQRLLHPDSLPDGSLSKSTAKRIEALAKLPLLPAGDGACELYAHLLDMLGAKDHEDAARIIAQHHAREIQVGDGARVTEEEWQATDAEILEWVERHGLGGMSVTDARCAFEDARTAHLAAREHTNGN